MLSQATFLLLLMLAPCGTQSPRSEVGDSTAAQQSFEERISKALGIEDLATRDAALIEIAVAQTKAKQFGDAKAVIINYVGDKDGGFASLLGACLKEHLYDEAKSTVAVIHDPERRAISWEQIAGSQLEAKQAGAARETLIAGLYDALKDEDAEHQRFTVWHIIEGMTRAGMTHDVQAAVDMVSPSVRLNAYITAAITEAQTGSLVEARRTFDEATKYVRNETEAVAEEGLTSIAKAQSSVGLITEAKETAAKIKDPSNRRAVLRYISLLVKMGRSQQDDRQE